MPEGPYVTSADPETASASSSGNPPRDPVPQHVRPQIPPLQLCHILSLSSGVKLHIFTRNSVGFWKNTVIFPEKQGFRARSGPGLVQGVNDTTDPRCAPAPSSVEIRSPKQAFFPLPCCSPTGPEIGQWLMPVNVFQRPL